MNKILADNLEKIRKYCKKYKVKELYAVGSVIGNSFNQESDIDFLIEFKNISIADYTKKTKRTIFANTQRLSVSLEI